MSEWQPIETAPRDGNDFLACGSYLYPGDKSVTWYMDIVGYSGDPDWPWESDEGKCKPDSYSHWMPLPPAPNPSE
jgi:hypothetical protein